MRKTTSIKICAALLALQAVAGCGKAGDTPIPPASSASNAPAAIPTPAPSSAATPVPAAPATPSTADPALRFIEKPDFTVVLEVTEKAAMAWKARNKPLVVVAELVDEYGPGMTALASPQKHSLREPGPTRFADTTIPMDKLQALRDPNYEIYVGVEPSTQPTELDCGYVQQLVRDLQQQSFKLACKLKGEA